MKKIERVSDFINLPVSKSKAYILGLTLPLFKQIKTKNNLVFVVGQVSHNANKIDETELLSHFRSVLKLIEEDDLEFEIKDNKHKLYGKSISSKVGFSVILLDDVKDSEIKLREILVEAIDWDESLKYMLIRGIFDGRSSVDTTYGYLSIDVDRNHIKQVELEKIINSIGLQVNINRRASDYKKNDQIRIIKRNKELFISKIGLFSIVRLENYTKVE